MQQISGVADAVVPNRAVLIVIWSTLLLAFYREVAGMPLLANLGNYNFTIVEAMLIIVCVSVPFVPKNPTPWRGLAAKLIFCLIILYCFAMLRGLQNAPYDAITSMRLNAALPIILIWSLLVPPKMLWHDSIQRAVIVVGVMLGLLVVLRVVNGPLFLMLTRDVSELDINDGGRALSAQGSIMLVSAVVLLIARGLYRPTTGHSRSWSQLILGALLALTEILTKQGTATMAMLGAIGVVFVAIPTPVRSTRISTLMLACFLVVVGILIGQDSTILASMNDSLPESMQFDLDQRGRTLETREMIWTGLLNDMENWSNTSKLVGLPAGTKPAIWIPLWGGTRWDFSIHSMYFGLLPVMGVVGLCLYVALLVLLMFGTLQTVVVGAMEEQLFATVAFAWGTVISILGFSYEIRNENSILLIMGLAATVAHTSSRTNSIARSRRRGHHSVISMR